MATLPRPKRGIAQRPSYTFDDMYRTLVMGWGDPRSKPGGSRPSASRKENWVWNRGSIGRPKWRST